MINRILNGSLGDTDTVSVKLSNGTSTALPKSLYKQLEPLYTTAYGIAYTYNLPEPKWEHFIEGVGESVITELAYLAFAKNPSKTGSWADVVKERIVNYPAPTNYLYSTQQKVVVEPEPQTVVEPEPQTVVEPEPQTVVEPEPQTVVEPEPQTVVEPQQEEDWRTWKYGDHLPQGVLDTLKYRADNAIQNPQNVPYSTPYVQTPDDDKKGGSSLLIPGLILIGGIIGAIVLSKKSSKRR